MVDLRQAPSGAPVAVDAGVTSLTASNGVAAAPSTGAVQLVGTTWDHVIASRAELVALVAPVGGMFALPQGSYLFTGPLELEANEGLSLVGSAFHLAGRQMQVTRLASNSNPMLSVLTSSEETPTLVEGLRFSDLGDAPACAQNVGINLQTKASTFESSNGIGFLNQGGHRDEFGRFEGSVNSYAVQSSGQSTCQSARFRPGAGDIATIDASAGTLRLLGGTVEIGGLSATRAGLAVTNISADVKAVGTTFQGGTSSNTLVSVQAANRVRLVACDFVRTTGAQLGAAVQLNGNCNKLAIVGNYFERLFLLLQRLAGTAGAITFSDNQAENHAFGISWPAASLPTDGLTIIGNEFDAAAGSCFSGFAATDARVFARANLATAGAKLSESAIVP